MESVLLKVTALRSKIDTCETSGQFEWVDSVLVKAVTYGHWLMISHANFCSPSVLDRLNAVMEPNGVLTLDEQGIMGESEPIIQPHPNFRLFLTMDPCHGEISRAMRNRGIEMYIHPEESILNLEKHSEDWRAMLLSKTSITPASCFNLLQLYPINANVSPHHLVSLARCHQLLMNRGGGDDAASLKEARNVLGWPMAVSSERMILSHFVPLSATASQLAAQASQIITCRDISSVLQALNKASLYPSELDHSTILSTSLSAALEVYVCSSTVEDQQSRLWQLNQLCGMLTDGHAINLTSSWRKVLDNLPDCTSFLEESFGCRAICQVYPSTNPLLSLVASQDQISLPVKMLPFFAKVDLLRILVKNHLETSNLGLSSLNSTLKLSLQAYNGSCPVECLPHHALAYLQPFVDNLLVVFSDLKFTYDNHVTTEVSTKMQMFTDWLAVFLSICMVPGCSLPAVVSAWTLFKSEGLQIVTSELQSHGEWECLNSLLLKIHPLEEAVHSARVYSHLRDHLFCPAVPSIVDEASQAQILKQDNEIRLSSTALPPFSFVSIEAVKARLKNISGSQSLFLPHRNDLEGSSSDLTATFVALQPLVYCIKSTVTGILQKGANYVTKLGREVTNILEYSLQLPTLSLWHLEPLINLDRCSKGVVDPKQVSGLVSGLVRTTSTGFVSAGQLSGGVLVERSFMTEMCYRLLSTPSSEVKTTGPPSIIPIEQISTKRKEVMAIREFIWLHENSSVFCPFKNLEMDAEIIQELFSSALFAVKDTVSRITKNLDEQNINRLDQSQWSNDEISNLFSKASTVLVDHSNDFFTYISTFCLEVQALLNKLQYALNCEADNGIVISELERLELLNQARAKVGLVYVILLTPSVVDPVALSTSEINCRNLLVTQTLELINAWDRHYLDMVGQDVKTLCSPINRSGVSPYLSSLLRRHSKWLEKSDHSQVTARHNERKYVTLQKTMEDVQRTICSPAHVVDLLQNLQGKVMDNSVYMKVTSWEKGVLGAVNMLENEHCDFPDVVHPYSMALCLVLQGVGSLSVIRRYREDCLNWPLEDVLKAVQFPIDPTYHSHLGWLQQLITLLMTPSKGNKPVSSVIESTDAEVILNKRLLRAVLSSSVAHLKQYHRRHVPLRACFTDLLDYFWVTWKKAQEAAKIESLEAESLYRWKSREHHIEQSGDSDYGEYIDMLFPSFDEEFSITDKPEAMSTRLEPSDTEDNDVALSRIDHLSLCDSDVNLICSLHMLLHNKDPLVSLENIQEPVQDLYHLASYCATCTRAVPGLAWDFLLQCTHARMCVTVGNSLSQNNKRAFNVYKEGDVAEAERSLPIINGIVSRVTELLIEWPEHPILNQLLSTCKKVLSLGTHEPLMKLIAGFESIFTKAQEWESYASKAVSLKSELDSLISIILDWRKLEFSFYENLLASCSSEMEASVSRWWFYLFGLCREVQVSGEVNEFTNAIQSFMETSTLGEYEGRLKLINTFRSDMIWTGSLKLADVLGNVFDYYSQFSAYVLTSMGKMTSSLTKAFKDQLSVMRWSDGSYWSVKVTIKNSHKKLVKLIKSYQEILSQPVLPVLTEMSIPLENQSDSTSNDSTSLVAIVRLNTQTKTKSPCNSYKMESSVLLEDKGLVVSEKDACIKMTDVIDIFFVSNQTVSWSESLTELTGNVITTVQQVSCIKYLEDIEPEKRDSAINLRQSLKRKMLSDLFKELTSHGLSFKKGLDFYSDQFPTTVFQLPNGSLPAEMQFEESLWGKMNVYYYRCIARLLALQSAFGNPSKELTMGQVSRCKGFAYILASTISEQRTTLMSVMREFTLLKATARRLNYSLTGNSGANNSDFCHWMRELCDCLEQCLYSLHCVEYLTNIAPDELDVSHTPLVMEALSFNSGLESGNQIATCILKDHKVDLHDAYTMFIKQESLWCTSIPYNLVSKQEFNNLVNGFQLVKRFCDSISSFLTSTTKSGRRSGLFSFLDTYRKHLLQKFTMVSEWVESVSSQEQSAMEGATSNLLVQSFIKSILLAFQNNSPEQVTVSVKSIREMHVQSLSNLKKINIMQITATAGEFHATLCTGVHQVSSQQIESICHLLQHYMSLCHVCIVQLMIVQATVCKLASILFNLFASLGSKGFCKPLAESQSKVSDSFDFVDIEAGGFAEGTGEKNISSQEDVDTENLESGHNEDKSNDRNKSEDDDVVSVADDMSEELCDVEDDERKEEESDVESKDEQYDNTVGDLEAQTEAEEDLNKHMWAPGVEQSEEDLAATDAAGGTENTESESIVAKDDTVCEETKPLVEDGEEREMDMQEPEQTDEQDTMKADDQDELIDDSESIASGMSDALSVVAEECEPFDFEDEANNEAELDEDESHLQDVPEDSALSTVTVCNSSTGCTTSNSMDGSSGQTDSGDAKTEALTEGDNNLGSQPGESSADQSMSNSTSIQNMQERRHRRIPHDEERVVSADLDSVAKRVKFTNPDDAFSDIKKEESSLYRHIHESESSLYDSTAWDWSDVNGKKIVDIETDDKLDENVGDADSNDQHNSGDSAVAVEMLNKDLDDQEPLKEDSSEKAHDGLPSSTLPLNFFSKIKKLERVQAPTISIERDNLIAAVTALHSDNLGDVQSAVKAWRRYVSLTSDLAQSLFEELCIVLTPTSASQLKGDYRSGKRLNMRRVIPFIASNYQNDRIWLRRLKLVERRYQILVAVDDSSSMKENNCMQMAYESLAMITTAVSRITNGQIGVCRFGDSANVLHPLDIPFSDSDGGNILQHLTFTQNRTSFKELLKTVMSIFLENSFKVAAHPTQPNMKCQLLLVLSDGRGVFSDGGMVLNAAIRRLTEFGIFTVFVILDTMSKESITEIKVPVFQDKGPVIKSYLELFPFSFYVIVRDLHKMPRVLGEALRQWFELLAVV